MVAITKNSDLDSDKVTPYFDGFSFTVSGAGTDLNDYKIPYEIYYTSFEILCSGQSSGDFIQLQAIDKDNILGLGANTILATPINKYYLSPMGNTKEDIRLGYPNRSIKDIYLRVSYTTTNILAAVTARFNLLGHRIIV